MKDAIKKMLDYRQTVKEYSDKKISDSDWEQIKDIIYWSPTSNGFEPYRVLTINKGHELRKKLQPSMWGQGVVENADKLVFFISLKHSVFTNKDWLYQRALRRVNVVVGKDGKEAEEMANGHLQTVQKQLSLDEPYDDWAMKQAYIALGNAMNGAALLGIGSTPMEGMSKKEVEKIFMEENLISNKERVAVAMALGYPSSKTAYAHWGSGNRVRDPREDKFTEI